MVRLQPDVRLLASLARGFLRHPEGRASRRLLWSQCKLELDSEPGQASSSLMMAGLSAARPAGDPDSQPPGRAPSHWHVGVI